METETNEFLAECGVKIVRKNRNYIAEVKDMSQVQIVFQRQEDIVQGVQQGSFAFGIAGFDLVSEVRAQIDSNDVLVIQNGLGFGKCTLEVAVPETWDLSMVEELKGMDSSPLRVASKFPNLTSSFLGDQNLNFSLVKSAGTLEAAPALGYADIIVDLVSSGQTLRDNRLKILAGGRILESEAVLVANRSALKEPATLAVAKRILELIEGTLRAKKFVSVFVNMRGSSDQEVAQKLFQSKGLEGLQGPTISKVFSRDTKNGWYAVHIIVERVRLNEAITALREVGGSGVVVSPTLYIFEEEPESYKTLLEKISVIK